MKRPLGTALIIAAIAIHGSFYASALHFDFWDYFFPRNAMHNRQGLDFYQVPNGAHSYWNGGSLIGIHPEGVRPYADANYNRFHPFFTVVVGTPLQWLPRKVAFTVWLGIHALVTAGLAFALVRRFRDHPDLPFALFLLLASVPDALEIWNGQYHFLVGAGVFWLMLRAGQPERPIADGALLGGTFLVKPVTLLWIPTLLMKRRWWTLAVALGILELATLPFVFDHSGYYYLNNARHRATGAPSFASQILAVDAVLLWLGLPRLAVRAIEIGSVVAILAAQWLRKLDLYRCFFLWIAFQLLFDYSFEYHYAILAPVLAVGVLTQPIFRHWTLRLCAILMISPSPYWLLYTLQWGADGDAVTRWGWTLMVAWRALPVLVACVLMVAWRGPPDAEPLSSPAPVLTS